MTPKPEIDTLNRYGVAAQGGTRVALTMPAPYMPPQRAVELAAWLVVAAETIDPDVDFAATLAAVKET